MPCHLFLGQKITKRQEFNRAAHKFRFTLNNHFLVLKKVESIDSPEEILADAISKVEIAFLEFEFLLCAKQRKRINAIWHEYNNKIEEPYHYTKFHCVEILKKENKELREALIKNIEKLIEFTKPE